MQVQGCGIAGAFECGSQQTANVLSTVNINAMVSSLKHRGPDAQRIVSEPGVLLGHTRLSILDLSDAGTQPMTRDNLIITFNGEIYNFHHIKTELEAEGFQFTSKTDTEIILRAFQKWGPISLTKFNGDFAFAIFDKTTKSLFLGIDRFGMKPLYYYQNKEVFLFSSEVESLMESGIVPAELNWENVYWHALRSGCSNLDNTPINGVMSLTPAHYMVVSKDGTTTKTRYWDFPKPTVFLPKKADPLPKKEADSDSDDEKRTIQFCDPEKRVEHVQKLKEILVDSVLLRYYTSDVPVSFFLSGGVDSSCAVSIAAKEEKPNLHFPPPSSTNSQLSTSSKSQKITCFSILSDKDSEDDLKFSKKVVSALGEDKVNLKVVPGLPPKISTEFLENIIDLSTFPEDSRIISIFLNYQAVAKNGYKVVINCQGPDEYMVGYANIVWFQYGFCDINDLACKLGDFVILQMLDAKLFTDETEEKCEQLQIEFLNSVKEAKAQGLYGVSKFLVERFLRILLRTEDFLSMRNTVESRVPFMDHNILDYCFKIPFELQANKDYTGKVLLREILKQYVGTEIAYRPKQPFPDPDEKQLFNDLKEILLQNFREIFEECELVKKIYETKTMRKLVHHLKPEEAFRIVGMWLWYKKFQKYKK